MQMGLVTNARVFKSPFTNAIQTVARQGEYWSMRLNFENRFAAERYDLMAFLVRLNGQENRIQTRDYSYTPRGVLTGTPLVNGAGQTGSTLIIDGCTASLATWGKAGDQIQIGTELKMLTQDIATDAGSNATLQFRPRMRTSPADNAPIVVSQPKGIFMLVGPEISWSTDVAFFSNFVVDAIEDVLS